MGSRGTRMTTGPIRIFYSKERFSKKTFASTFTFGFSFKVETLVDMKL
jgi:hypothetical protein